MGSLIRKSVLNLEQFKVILSSVVGNKKEGRVVGMSLYDPREYAPFAKNDHKIMQPSCRARMVEARDTVFSGLLQKDMVRADEGLYLLQPLLKCSVANVNLPCSKVCSQELYEVTMPLQLVGEERTLEIARQSTTADDKYSGGKKDNSD